MNIVKFGTVLWGIAMFWSWYSQDRQTLSLCTTCFMIFVAAFGVCVHINNKSRRR